MKVNDKTIVVALMLLTAFMRHESYADSANVKDRIYDAYSAGCGNVYASNDGGMLRSIFDASGLSSNQFSDVLCELAVTNATADNIILVKEAAIRGLARFGTTNALPTLAGIVTSDDVNLSALAMESYIAVDHAGPACIALIESSLAKKEGGSLLPMGRIYRALDEFAPSDSSDCVKSFLVSRIDMECRYALSLDNVLCRRIPDYSNSVQRLAAARFALVNSKPVVHGYFSNVVERLESRPLKSLKYDILPATNSVSALRRQAP